MLKEQGFELFAMSFRYGQRHAVELAAASRVASWLGVAEHRVVDIDLRAFGGSALTADIAVPKDALTEGEIPITYVPARNTIFLSYALAWAEVLGAFDIGIGVNAVDYSGYPDCRPEFVAAFERVANLGTKVGVSGATIRIHTPLIDQTKVQIIREGLRLGLDYGLTSSCYDPIEGGKPCGHCDSCLLRIKAFAELGMQDPASAP